MHPRSHWLVAASIAVSVAVSACREPAPAREERALGAQLSGCAALLRGPVCELGETRQVRVVLALSGHEQASFFSDRGAVRELASRAVTGGRRFALEVPPGARVLGARVRGATYEAIWKHALADATPRPWLARAEAQRKAGDVSAATSLAEAHLETAEERAFALGVLGRIALRNGDFVLGRDRLHEAASLHERAGQLSLAARALFALSFFSTEELHLDEADAVLRQAERMVAPASDDAAKLAFYRGQLACALGDFEAGLDLIEASERAAERAGDEIQAQSSLWERLRILYLLGDSVSLEQLHRRLSSAQTAALDGCDALTLLASRAYARNTLARGLADEARREQARATEAMLAQDMVGCPDRHVVNNLLIELAHAQLLAGALDEAEATLGRARGALDEPALHELLLEHHDLRGRLALERGDDARAVTTFTEMEAAASGERWLEPRARALAQRALAEARSGHVAAALATYERMEAALDALTARAPLGADRAGVSASLDAFSDAHARLLLERSAEDALAISLRSRARRSRMLHARSRLGGLSDAQRSAWSQAVAALERARRDADALEAKAWQLPEARQKALASEREQLEHDALRAIDAALGVFETGPAAPLALGDDELLATFLADESTPVALVRHGSVTEARPLPKASDSPGATARSWLGALSDLLTGVKRLVLVPPLDLEAVDWHALPFEGQPLSTRLEVVYSQSQPAPGYRVSAGKLLVIADPTGNLPEARAEAAWLGSAWPTTPLFAAAATPDAVRRELERHELFHFAGHTLFDAEAPWRAGLVLSGNTRFGLVDVLGLSRAPGLVVLSSCEAAGAVGAAFLAAGSKVVIAPTRRVADALSRRFTEAFYGALADVRDPVRAAHLAQAKLRDAGAADWAAFRVLVP